MGTMTRVQAVLFDYSGTLFRLEEDESWFAGMEVDEREVDGHVQAELMRRLTAADRTGRSTMTPEAYHAWVNRDLAPHLHREAYLHVLRESGLADHHAEALYDRVIDPASWTPYPDTADVLAGAAPRASRRRWCPTSPSTCGRRSRRSAPTTSTSSCCRSRSAPSSPTPRSSRAR